ncbi:translation initiation factor IF-2-like [Mesocricetus auratus]|uniref:Translation initiation factor IF-2-like n=1 Tax=Mesocricetus auratus TaxID=10036 RepID=A0ABM2XEF9_MESAU|nr:translation initiation factor IF-2-like [Mesocricetus auratus]
MQVFRGPAPFGRPGRSRGRRPACAPPGFERRPGPVKARSSQGGGAERPRLRVPGVPEVRVDRLPPQLSVAACSRRPRGPRSRGGPGIAVPRARTQSGPGRARLTCSTGRRGPSRTIGPRSGARVTGQASRCRPAPPPPPPFPAARRRLVPAVRLLHLPEPGAARASPRRAPTPSRPRLRRLRSALLARSPRSARGDGAQRLGESHRRRAAAPRPLACSPRGHMKAAL